MKIHFNFSMQEKRTEISAIPGRYEAVPLRPVVLYGTPILRNPDRLYVAAALLFRNYHSGPLSISDIEPCSRHVALQIERFFAPVDVFVMEQTIEPRGNPTGSFRGILTFSHTVEKLAGVLQSVEGDTVIRFVSEGVGAMFSEQEVIIGTNLLMDLEASDNIDSDICAHIGAAMLFCEDLQINTLHILKTNGNEMSLQTLKSIKELLSAVSLYFEW